MKRKRFSTEQIVAAMKIMRAIYGPVPGAKRKRARLVEKGGVTSR